MRHAMVLGFMLVSLGASAAERWTAPYQLEDQRGRTFRVVFGGNKAPKNVESRLGIVTLVGKKGLATARLQRVEKVCTPVCDAPECHSVGVYTQEPGTKDVGEGLVALPGRIRGQMDTPAPVTPAKPPSVEQWSSREFQVPVDERTGGILLPEGVPPAAFRWTSHAQGGAQLQRQQGGVDFFTPPIQLAECQQEQQPPFTRLTCPAASLLYEKQQLLFASFDEYGVATTEWVATLQAGGQTLYLVRVGLKTQAVIGLLFHEGGRWRLLVRQADYSLIC
ncbi:hypothetical protein HPC49_02135 [Pyxidicoccus fallax]|uniref:Lipoprotein n=1 Tax=Pyxidicoccus fallax TaxID=394095 RepID=A0A848LCR2_9BACT|nr:hypothetical protein [Pyxidicoccus fallax]NMO14533.1 hypothetical protein [Pyxidicoccus fallax]NPC77052.1 hypothetical protein [Pyxidicoccus fallax]